ncbi:MAG: hypothetical protein Q4F69_11330 [Bacteroidia bacterium]|nr:hypothetical protein [Bacteroidia bacterium]
MKKFSLIISVLALVLGLAQCAKKPNMPTFNGGFTGVNKTITFTANGGDGSKSEIDNTVLGKLTFKWEENDVLYVYGSKLGDFTDGKCCGMMTLTSEPGSEEGTFSGVVEIPEGDAAKLRFYYLGGNVNKTMEVTADVDLSAQDGGIDGLEGKIIAVVECNADEDSYSGKLEVPFAIVQFDLKDFAGENAVAMIGIKYNKISVAANGDITKTNGANTTLDKANLTEDKYYVAVIADDVTNLEFNGNGCIGNKVVKTGDQQFLNGVFYTNKVDQKSVKVVGVKKLLSGLFSVAANKQVRFTTGNLYWDYDSFEIEDNPLNYTKEIDKYHIDHFFWQPYSRIDKVYTVDGNNEGKTYDGTGASTSDIFFTNGQTDETMGKANPELTVSGVKGMYRVLTEAEMNYLKNTRDGAASKRGYAVANGVRVMIILPDAFTLPEGCGFVADDGPDDNPNFNQNTYTSDQVTAMAEAGAVFLPLGGFYCNDHGEHTILGLTEPGCSGLYWLADPKTTSASPSFTAAQLAAGFHFSRYTGFQDVYARQHGYLVRLVSDAINLN